MLRMHQSKEQLYDLVKDIYSPSDFEYVLNKRSAEYGGLLDQDTLALLLVDEHGRNKQVVTSINNLKANTECTVTGVVSEIHKQRHYKKRNGCDGKILRVDIHDDTGSCRLILWNDDVDMFNHLKEGVKIKVINGYVKKGLTGDLEIHIGRWSLIEIIDEINIKKDDAKPDGNMINKQDKKEEKHVFKEHVKEISGILTSRRPTRVYFMDNGDFGFVTTINIKKDDDENEIECTLWGEKVKEIQSFRIGDRVRIIKPTVKERNSIYEYHVNGDSVIKGC
jgi:ssDNA-binding replication factor A large subunit